MNQRSDVDSYIIKFDAEKQRRLMAIRSIVFEKYPNATERIYYGIPTVEVDGKIILHYAAYKNHISLITGYDLTDFLKSKYPQYRYTRATLIMPDDQPFPEAFVNEVCGMLGQG